MNRITLWLLQLQSYMFRVFRSSVIFSALRIHFTIAPWNLIKMIKVTMSLPLNANSLKKYYLISNWSRFLRFCCWTFSIALTIKMLWFMTVNYIYIYRPRTGFDKSSLERLEQLFRKTVGIEKEIRREDFKKIVISKNVWNQIVNVLNHSRAILNIHFMLSNFSFSAIFHKSCFPNIRQG